MNDFKQERKNLIDMLEDLDEQLGEISDDEKHQDEPDSTIHEDQTFASETGETSDSFESVPQSITEQIKQTIFGIDSRKYGVCLICGQAIKKKPLKALPYYSALCLQCAEKKDHD